jgi:hypothetical protein
MRSTLLLESGSESRSTKARTGESVVNRLVLTQDGSELKRPVSSRSVDADVTPERSLQMAKYLDR